MTEATTAYGPCLDGLAFAVEKPGSFVIDYNVPKNDLKLNLTCIHSTVDRRTMLNGTLAIDSDSKVSASHVAGTWNAKMKHTYSPEGLTTFESSYELGMDGWDLSVSGKLLYADSPDMNDLFRATCHTSNKDLDLQWLRSSQYHGTFQGYSNHQIVK